MWKAPHLLSMDSDLGDEDAPQTHHQQVNDPDQLQNSSGLDQLKSLLIVTTPPASPSKSPHISSALLDHIKKEFIHNYAAAIHLLYQSCQFRAGRLPKLPINNQLVRKKNDAFLLPKKGFLPFDCILSFSQKPKGTFFQLDETFAPELCFNMALARTIGSIRYNAVVPEDIRGYHMIDLCYTQAQKDKSIFDVTEAGIVCDINCNTMFREKLKGKDQHLVQFVSCISIGKNQNGQMLFLGCHKRVFDNIPKTYEEIRDAILKQHRSIYLLHAQEETKSNVGLETEGNASNTTTNTTDFVIEDIEELDRQAVLSFDKKQRQRTIDTIHFNKIAKTLCAELST